MSNVVNATVVSDPDPSVVVTEGVSLSQTPYSWDEIAAMLQVRRERNQREEAARLQARAEQRARMRVLPFVERILAPIIEPRTRIHPGQEPGSSSGSN